MSDGEDDPKHRWFGKPPPIKDLRDEALPAKRRAGRPPGSSNRSLVTEVRLKQHSKARSFLHRVIGGGKIKAGTKIGDGKRQWCFPTIGERLKACELQLRDVAIVAAIQSAEQGTPLGANLDALNGPQLLTLITALRQSAHAAGPRPIAVNAEFTQVETVVPIREGLRPQLSITQKDEPK